ncbi:MAG: hydrogen gas-evolving membrane-bound hydrogenase subunit E [Oligoflexus sp.]
MMLFAIIAPFLAAPLALLFSRFANRAMPWLLGLVPISIFIYTFIHFPTDSSYPLSGSWNWFPQVGAKLDFRLDALSAIFTLLISGIGFLVLIYAGGYFGHEKKNGRFFAFLMGFMGAMLGVVLTDNVFTLFIFWELTSITSYMLIGFKHESKDSRDAALQALLVTGVGGLALLVGMILLVIAGIDMGLPLAEATQFSQLKTIDVTDHPLYLYFTSFILIGAFTKSAQFPFHFWLPGAMAAPTPVSSYLHSATMVKAGVFLLAKTLPILGGTWFWHTTVGGVGAVTMLVGAAIAMMQRDLKLILAFSTVSVLGTLTMLLGIGSELAVKACVVYLLAHAMYKAAMFQVAGIVDKQTGTRDVLALRGLRPVLPVTAVIAFLAALSMAGFPPFFGFYSKELLYDAGLGADAGMILIILASYAAAVLTVVVALLAGFRPFLGSLQDTPKKPVEAPFMMLLGPGVLASLGVLLGLLPFLVDSTFLTAVASNVYHTKSIDVDLALWHGIAGKAGVILLLSLATFGLAALLLRKHADRLVYLHENLVGLSKFGPQVGYQLLLEATYRETGRITRLVQNGYLRFYIKVIVLFFVAVTAWPLWTEFVAIDIPEDSFFVGPIDIALVVMMTVGLSFVARTHKRLSAVAGLGLLGFGVVLFFSTYSAPDLAITQVLIEVLTVILFVLVFYHLPGIARFTHWPSRLKDFLIAAAVGITMTGFILITQSTKMDPILTEYFANHSWTKAFGRNVVNVILVDFRAFDTMGEIIVVAIAGFGVFALLSQKTKQNKPEGDQNS